ncbi:Phage integrase family protein [Priestia aryabhattai B8W22]|uniref:tyrosine-type recombinase/integrase n=1 Tax=Priestia aryabhattai TaxID=412384 RepID=UPI00088C68A3|nr:Phage integrase family protein [Priestia aryabhattai B8W22]
MIKTKNVQPLRSVEEIKKMENALLRYCGYRDYFLFLFGINTGLRISDILPLRVKDIRHKTQFTITEKKTKKIRIIYINEILKAEINKYTASMECNDFLFPSKKGSSYITPTQAYRRLQKAAEIVGIEHTATHSLRKTFGYHHYKMHGNLTILKEFFSHASTSVTKQYIGITDDELKSNNLEQPGGTQ